MRLPSSPRSERAAILLIALLSAWAAAATHPHPTANAGSDVLLSLAFGGGLVYLAALGRPPAWIAAAAVSAAGASGAVIALGIGAVVIGLTAQLHASHQRSRLLGSVSGALIAQTLLHLPTGRPGVNTSVAAAAVGCLLLSAWPRLARLKRPVAVVAVLAGSCLGVFALSALLAYTDITRGIDHAQDGLAAAKEGNSDRAASLLDDAGRAFRSAHGDLSAWWAQPARLLPVIGQQARAMDVLADQGAGLADAAATSARRARVEDLEVVEGRLDLRRVHAMAAPLAAVAEALRRADHGVLRAESPWLLPPIAEGLASFQRSLTAATRDAATASEAIAVVPELLGEHGSRSYFVAFGTPAEARDLGGFMGAYAILEADNGELSLASTGRVRDLNETFRHGQFTDRSVFPSHYLALRPQTLWQNLTGTADFPTMAEAVHQLWLPREGRIDGVFYVDPKTVASLLTLTGPVQVPGYDQPLTAETALPFLLRDQYVAFPDDDRHDVLADTAAAVFEQLTSGNLPGPNVLVDTLAPAVRERRLLLNSFQASEQALFERLGVDGALPPVQGDFLSVRASNRGLNKIDALMRREVAYDVTVDPRSGSIRSTVTVTVTNDAPSSGLPSVVIGNQLGEPAGTNSTTVSIYTPLDLVDVRQGWRSIGRAAYPEFGRNKFAALLDVPAGGEVTVTFELEGSIDLRAGYHLDLVPQPLVRPDRIHVRVRAPDGWTSFGTTDLVGGMDRDRHLDAFFLPGL